MRFSFLACGLFMAVIATVSAQLSYTGTQSSGFGAITNPGTLDFFDDATAGTSVITNPVPNTITFHDRATAGAATIYNQYSTIFTDHATAGTSVITTWFDLSFSGQASADHATLSIGSSAGLGLYDTASLGFATVTNSGFIVFNGTTTADHATIINSYSLRLHGNSTLGVASVFNTNTSSSVINLDDTSSLGGAVVTNDRTLNANDSSSLGSAYITNSFRINLLGNSTAAGATIVGTLTASTDISGHNGPVTLGALSGRGIIELGGNFLSIGALNFDTTFGGTLGSTGSFPGIGGGITKIGLGRLALTGHNVHTGATTVSAGTLVAAGDFGSHSSMGNGAVRVLADATLAGNDYIPGVVTVEYGGHLAPGNPTAGTAGWMEFLGGLTLNDGAILDFNLSAATPTYLTLAPTGTLTGPGVWGTVTVNLTDLGDFSAGTYTLIDFGSGTVTDLYPGSFALGSTIAGYNYSLDLTGTSLALTATSAVPEPSTYAALAGALALGAAWWRRRA